MKYNIPPKPTIKPIQNLTIPQIDQFRLLNDIDVYAYDSGIQHVMKFDLVFEGGRYQEVKQLCSKATSYLIKEGTKKRKSAEIAEYVDYYGATLRSYAHMDYCGLSIYCLTKYFDEIFHILWEILNEPIFPLEEVDKYKSNSIQHLQNELSNNDFIAFREYTEKIYGSDHPYGYNSSIEGFNTLDRQDIIRQWAHQYTPDNATLFISGKLPKDIDKYYKMIETWSKEKSKEKSSLIPIQSSQPATYRIPSTNSFQTSFKLGKPLFAKNHTDYPAMAVLNTILGGYFGSRLMTNIRENKGYTYNIYSSIDTYLHGGDFNISADVSPENETLVLTEIKNEIHKLQNELISDRELKLVKNYILGNLLNNIDGPFNTIQLLKSNILKGINQNEILDLTENIKNVSNKKLKMLANTYLQTDSFIEVFIQNKT